jgi:hypothetical protein
MPRTTTTKKKPHIFGSSMMGEAMENAKVVKLMTRTIDKNNSKPMLH